MSIRSRYREDGFIVARGLVSGARLAEVTSEAERLWAEALEDLDAPKVQWRTHVSGERRPDRIDPAWPQSPLLEALGHEGPLPALCSELFGEPASVFKDKLIMKMPGNFGYEVHQDFPYWERYGAPADAFLTLMLAIDGANETNGALELVPGRHDKRLPSPDDAPNDVDPAALAGANWVSPQLAPGDAMLFHSLAPHRSQPNTSAVPRRAYFVSYCTEAAAQLIGGVQSTAQVVGEALYAPLRREG